MDQYAHGDPSAWGEDVNTDDPAKGDEGSRDKEIRHASSKEAAEAVKTARQLEQKAVKCIVAAQRMLPGAADEIIEAQAADLMELPESALMATLSRQEKLAQEIVAKAEDCAEDCDEEKSAAKKEDEEAEEVEASKKEDEEAEEVEASKKEDEEAEEVEASKKEDEEAEEVEASKKEDEEAEEDMEKAASEDSLLDQIFSSVQASDNKKGASSLSGIVKKEASEKSDDLSKLWGSTPDVSHVFGR
jgi:hypothetical protein